MSTPGASMPMRLVVKVVDSFMLLIPDPVSGLVSGLVVRKYVENHWSGLCFLDNSP